VSTRDPQVAALRAALTGDKRIRGWQIQRVRRAGFQTYLVRTEPESERRTEGVTTEATVFVENGDKLGRAGVTLFAGDGAAVADKVEAAVFMAGLGGDQPWSLPAASPVPAVATFDPALSGDRARATARELAAAWRTEAVAHAGVRPSSMELFCGEDTVSLENSAGFAGEWRGTRVSLLTLLLADGEKPSERYSWEERRRVSDLDVRRIVARAAEEARDLTRAVVPPSGQYPVVIDAAEIAALLNPIQVHSSGDSLYQKSSRFELGKPLPIEAKGGEPFSLATNAALPYGLQSYAFDGTGIGGRRVEIVKDGVFTNAWVGKQQADYLKVAATGAFSNWELPAGKTPLADLTGGDGPVLYVRNFSWLTPDQARGNFGSEVRVGYLYEKGARKPIKGGTVSGNVFAALGTAKWSKETVFLGEYSGPAAVRLEGLTVAGG